MDQSFRRQKSPQLVKPTYASRQASAGHCLKLWSSSLLLCLTAAAPATVLAEDGSAIFQQTAAGLVAVEAEHYSAQQPQSGYEWTAAANPGSSGSGALQAAPEDSVKLAAGAGPRLDYPVHFSYTGTHYVWVRGLGPSGNSDSLYIGLDGVPTPAVLPLYPNGDWLWRHTTWEGTVVTLNVTSPGLHTLNVWMRESGSVLDKLVLTTDANYTPTATGPAETAGATGTATVMVDPDTPTSLTVPAGDGTVSLTADPAHGTAAVNGDTIVYVPQQGYHGQDNLVFQITSPTGAVSVHTVTLQVGCSDCLADGYPTPSPLVISHLSASSGRAYQLDENLQNGHPAYIDRSYTFTNVASYGGMKYIVTANDDKSATGPSFLQFDVNKAVDVYVAYDQRTTSLPGWLSGWTDTGTVVSTTDGTLKVYRRSFPIGTITLGGNAMETTGARSMYGVLVSDKPIPDPWDQVPEIVAKIISPRFPSQDCVITDYGAVADDSGDDTDAFTQAIDACHSTGGGRVIVPSGTFRSGAIHLKSNINLYVSQGATIKFSTDPDKYLPAVYTRWGGVELYNYSALIYAYKQENIAITGAGTLDGQASSDNWWRWNSNGKEDITRSVLFRMAEDGIPVDRRVFGNGDYLRPNFVQFYSSRNILIEGVTFKDSPMWFLHPVLCSNVTVSGVRVVGHGPNNDGIDPESSQYVLIQDSYFDNGDDNIAIKSGRNADGRRVNVPSENIVIRNNQMKDGHGAVVIGSETSGNVRNVFAEHITAGSPNLGHFLRIKTNSVRGGIVENIYVRNSTISQVSQAVVRVNMFYEEGDTGDYTPIVRNIGVQNLTCSDGEMALQLEAYKRSPLSNVRVEDSTFAHMSSDNILLNVMNLQLINVYINGVLQ
jgi:polygalacturonase